MTYEEVKKQSLPLILSEPELGEIYIIYRDAEGFMCYRLINRNGIRAQESLRQSGWDNRGWWDATNGVPESMYKFFKLAISEVFTVTY